MKKGLLKIAALAGLLTSTSALSHDIFGLDIQLGGVSMSAKFTQQLFHKDGLTSGVKGDYKLRGYGRVNNVNEIVGPNNNDAPFTCSNVLGAPTTSCNLVITFGGFTLDNVTGTATDLDLEFNTSGAYVNFYLVDSSVDLDVIGRLDSNQKAIFDPALFNTLNGLSMSQQYLNLKPAQNNITVNQLLPTPTVLNPTATITTGFEVDDQTIGAGWYHDLEDNTLRQDVNFSTTLNGSTLTNTNNLTFVRDDGVEFNNLSRLGTGSVAITTQVPEPSTLAMFSVALLGFGAAARRRRQA